MTSIIGREAQREFLQAAFEGHLPQALYIWGPPATGKTFVLNSVIEECNVQRTARISALEIMCGKRPFFETLMKQLKSTEKKELDETENRCENLRVFVEQLRRLYHGKNSQQGKTVIIVDEAEYLRAEHSDILNVLPRLQELCQSNICVVMLSSEVSSIGFSGVANMRCVPVIHFPQYSKEEIVCIITTCHKPENAEKEMFETYVGMVADVFYMGCRDLKKLLRLTISNWEFVREQQTSQQTSLRKVWKDIVPKLRQDFTALNSQILPMLDEAEAFPDPKSSSKISLEKRQPPKTRNYDDIPKYSRYILIASYLATHNPPSADKRFFVKCATRKHASKKTKYNVGPMEETENASERTRALRSFDQNRLKSIFAFLVSYCSGGTEPPESNVDWLMQISSLCQSQFLQNLGEDASGNFKYRCLADYDFILKISSSVNFELEKYLCRFL